MRSSTARTSRNTSKTATIKAINCNGVYMNSVRAFLSPKKLRTRLSASLIVFMIASLLCLTVTVLAATLISSTGDGGFETGVDFPTNGWTVVNGANNRLFVGSAPVVSAGTRCAFSGLNSTTWTGEAVANVNHFYRDVTFPAGDPGITLSFKYKINAPDATFDFLRVFLVPTTTTPVAGTQLAVGQIGSTYDSATSYTTVTIPISGSNAGTTQRLVFSWKTDGVSPHAAVAVDEISLVTGAGLTGAKTIDNTLPTAGNNYASFTAAINDLNASGVGSGGVTFNVTSGQTFTEDTPVITATGIAANPIVFQKSGAGANPIIKPTGTAGTVDFGLCITGGDFITFDGIDITINSGSAVEYGYLVRNFNANDGAQSNTIQNTSVTLNRANTTSVGILQSSDTLGGGFTPTTTGGANSNNHYYNLSIQNVYSGIYLRTLILGGDTNNEVGVTGGGTTVVGGAAAGDIGAGSITTWGIRAIAQTNVKIFKTEVRNVSVTSTVAVDGIYLDQAIGTSEAFGNQVHDIRNTSTSATTAMSGIRATFPTTATGNTIRVYNNFVWNILTGYTGAATATRQVKGIRVQDNNSGSGNTANIDFNSVRLDLGANLNMSSSAFAISTTSGPVFNIRNNIFANVTGAQAGVAKHYAWETSSATAIGPAGSVSDHNVLYAPNTNGFVGLGNATDYATIAAWRAAVGQDFHSKSSDPQFSTATNLHINPAVATDVESGGSYFNGAITWVTQDIDMQTRNATFPDIGADEGTFTAAADTTYPDIFLPSFSNSTNTTSRTFTATILDPSGVPTAGMGLPVLYFRKGAVGAFTAVQGVHAGGNNYTFTINYAAVGGVVAGDVIQFYIVAQDNLNNVGALPAVGAAIFTANPPAAVTPPTTPFSYTIVNGFSGTINVPGAFPSLTNTGGLFAAINGGVLTGNVVVNITSDLTAETGTVSLNQFSDEGGGATFTLTIQPSGARIISGSNTTVLINLNGADRTTFNGLNTGGNSLLIRNTSATTGAVVQLTNDASNNSVTNCTIQGGNTGTSSALVLIATGTTTGNDNNTISNNIVRDRTDVVGVPANLIASLNASITATNSNNVITGNQLTNFTANGFATSSAVTSDNWTITNNDISQTAARTTTIFGINTGGPAGTNLISGNSIHGFNTNGANTSLGILIGNASNLTISRNRIYDFQTTAGATGVIEGMEFDGASGTTATVNVVNNMVSLAPTLATAQPIIGIQDFGFGGNVFTANYNSIYIGGTATGAASSWALRRGTGAPTTYTARNNIAFNNRTGGTGNHFAGGDQSANTGTFVSNYNIFVGTGATAANFFDYGTSSTGTPVNFAAWQAGPPTRDANSQASNPGGNYTLANFFISATDLHLNTTGTNPAISAGTPVGGVTTDFDNDPRPASNPDIGADEVVMATGGTLAAGTYYNVSTANGDTLGGDVTVTNQLTLNGVLNTGSFTLTMDCGASVVGAGASSYVIGNVRKNYCVNGSFTYPVGTANGYSPVDATITLIINPSSLMVKAVQGARPGLNASTSLQRYWTLTETSGDLTANLTFNYLNDPNPPNPQNTNDVMGNEANYRIIRVEGSTFTNFPNNCPSPCVDATANTATVNGVNNFSDWTLGEPDAPTAVRLRSFAARRTENGVLLEWDSGFEVDNLGYNIYREQNGVRVLVTPSLVAGSALKTGPGTQLTAGMSYAWWDMNASASAQYWLEDVDLEGKNTMYGPFTQQAASGTARPVASTLLSELTAGKSGAAASAAQREWPAAIDAQSPKSVSAINRAETSSLEQQFGLAGQAAVKLSVNQDGWYRVTGAELVAAGLDANADSTRLQLYLNGEELPIKVGADGTVEFYGRRLDAPATDRNVYWLIEGTTPGQRIQMLPVLPAGAQFATGFPVTVERQDKMIYFASLQNGEASNIFGPVVNSQSATQALQLRHLDGAANSPAQLEVALQGVTSQSHLVSVTLNGQQVGVVSFTGREHAVWQVPVPMNALAEGENIVTLSRMNGDGDTSLVDYVRVTYARTYQAEANQLACTVAAGSTVKLGGFTTDDIRVIDVSDASQPRELSVTAEPDGLGFAVSFDVAAAAQLLAFTGSSPMQQPAAMVANEPSAWNGLRHGANMVMITHRDFRQAVEPLAAHRRQQGLSVVVIDVEDIYDEFSYSAHGPQAIKDFLEWTHQHWPASPQYVLLVGDSSWDARNELSLTQSEYVPTKLVDTTYMETASDDWLADFNNDGIAEMGIGRLPVKTAGQAATIVQKIIAYDQLRFDPRRGAMLVADNGFEAMSADIHSVIPDRMPVQIINRSSASDPVIRQQILDGINAGPRIVNYYGHGSIQVWTGAGLLQNSDANNLTNGSKLAVFTLMNCLNGYAHDAYIDSLGEALLKAENGGAVAVWASSGYTEPGGQAQVNRQLYQQVFTDSAVRLGDAIRSAKGATTNPDVRRTWVLLGDPSMRVK